MLLLSPKLLLRDLKISILEYHQFTPHSLFKFISKEYHNLQVIHLPTTILQLQNDVSRTTNQYFRNSKPHPLTLSFKESSEPHLLGLIFYHMAFYALCTHNCYSFHQYFKSVNSPVNKKKQRIVILSKYSRQ